ncbi:hypothetical protein STEG23_006582 [Scotinomys teguina]
MPPFVQFFEKQADAKRDIADQFLRRLHKREGRVCPPIHQRPNMNEITTPIQAIALAQELEKSLTQDLSQLKTIATKDRETDVMEMAKPPTVKPEDVNSSSGTQSGRKELTPISCPRMFMLSGVAAVYTFSSSTQEEVMQISTLQFVRPLISKQKNNEGYLTSEIAVLNKQDEQAQM